MADRERSYTFFKIEAFLVAGQVVSFVTSPIHVPLVRAFIKVEPADGVEACQ